MVTMELKTRRVEIAGVTSNPHADWMHQVCRELTNDHDGFLKDASHLIVDWDGSFLALRDYLTSKSDIEAVVLPPKNPNLNAFQERFFRSVKSECLEHMIFFSEQQLRRTLKEFVTHYHAERNHQGLNNRMIVPGDEVGCEAGEIKCRERLCGMLKYYYRDAA